MSTKRNSKESINPAEILKLDLSYGELPADHPFKRIDGFNPVVDKVWPFRDATIEEAFSSGLFQRVPKAMRGVFMDELWRVMKTGAKCTMIVPYWSSVRAIQDPMAEWPPLCENSFLYFNRKFREDNKLNSPWKSDFEFQYGYGLDQETATKTDELRPFWAKHYLNAVNDLHLVLVKRAAA